MNIPAVGAFRTADPEVPTLGLWRNKQHQYFAKYPDLTPVDYGPLPGVTGSLRMIDKPAIAIWRGNTVAEFIADNLPMFTNMVEKGGKVAAAKYAASLPNYQRDLAADTGTLVHVLVEKLLRKQAVIVPSELHAYAVAFRRFLKDHRLRQSDIISVERMVANLTLGYGGTFDFLLNLDGSRTLLDVKTWRKRPIPGSDTYAETGIQLAAYSNAEFTGIPDDPKRYAPPRPETTAVLHLRPDLYERGYAIYPFEATDAEMAAFVALLSLYRWKEERSKHIIHEARNGVVKGTDQ